MAFCQETCCPSAQCQKKRNFEWVQSFTNHILGNEVHTIVISNLPPITFPRPIFTSQPFHWLQDTIRCNLIGHCRRHSRFRRLYSNDRIDAEQGEGESIAGIRRKRRTAGVLHPYRTILYSFKLVVVS